MNQTPKISVIVAAYNAEKYVGRCLESLLGQPLTDIEVIVVDDGSTDDTGLILEEWAAKDNRLKVIHQPNQGVSIARSRGAEEAGGSYYWFVDSDDYLLPGALEEMCSLLNSYPQHDVFVAPVLIQDKDGKERIKPYAKFSGASLSGRDYMHLSPISVCPVQFVFRREIWQNKWVFFPAGLRHEDEYFCRTLQYFAPSLYLIHHPLYVYRQSDSSYMGKVTAAHAYDMVEIYKYLSTFIEKGVHQEDRKWLKRDSVSFLMSTHFWYKDLFGTSEFNQFRKDKLSFIRREFITNASLFSCKNRLIACLILSCPVLFAHVQSLFLRHKRDD